MARPLELTLDDLQTRYPARSVVATLQCAGARRAAMTTIAPIPDEAPWGPCATSTAEWTGVALAEVLADAGLEPDAAHVAFTAPDVSRLPVPPETYGSSIPRGKATAPEVLLAWGMNGEPLPALHGGPLRVVVPGFIGARSVKWVTAVTAQRTPSDNYFQAVAYRLLPADADPASRTGGLSLTSVALNSDILRPDDGARVAAGPVRVSGYAYAGDDRAVARVDVSVDEGRTWRQAELDRTRCPGPGPSGTPRSTSPSGPTSSRSGPGTPREPRSRNASRRCGTRRVTSTTRGDTSRSTSATVAGDPAGDDRGPATAPGDRARRRGALPGPRHEPRRRRRAAVGGGAHDLPT